MSVYEGLKVKAVNRWGHSNYKIGDIYTIGEDNGRFFYLHEANCWGDKDYLKFLLDENFLKIFKEKKIVIYCETEDEAIKFCNWMHNAGLKWCSGVSLLENNWDKYCKEIYYGINNNGVWFYDNEDGGLWFKERDHTIIDFKNCIIEDKNMDIKEFIKYWKESQGAVAVKFDNLKDKNDFLYEVTGNKNESRSAVDRFVHYKKNISGWDAYMVSRSFMKEIIDYKDIKNYKKDEQKMEYKITKPFTIGDIIKKNPCSNEFFNLTEEMEENGCSVNYKFHDDDLNCFETLKRNLTWLEENGFIKKQFKPFDLTLRIENMDELKELWCRLNISDLNYRQTCSGMTYFTENTSSSLKLWKQIDAKLKL